MRTVRDGYTIIEVMIVLAISTALFASAMAIFSGQQGSTEFTQTMRDLESKIQDYTSQVSNGTYPDTNNYVCTVVGIRPQLALSGTSKGDCVFLGRVLSVDPNSKGFTVYSVLGTRNIYAGGIDTGEPVTGLDEASPEVAAIGGARPIVEYSSLSNGATVNGSRFKKPDGSYTNAKVAAFYSIAPSSTAGSPIHAAPLLMKGYVTIGGTYDEINKCVEQDPSCLATIDSAEWRLCIDSGIGKRAELVINNSSVGVNTSIVYGGC